MRKLILLAAMLTMVLVAAAPAMAQVTVITGDSDGFDDDNFGLFDDDFDNNSTVVNGSQTQFADVSQVNTGDANAATDDGTAVAVISQELAVEQDATQQVEASGFGFFDGDLDNDGILDDFEVFDNDFDNDGVQDQFE